METDRYFIFLKVLESKSFSGAARELGYTQAAISHSMNALEQFLGFRLLDRGREVKLTDAGREMLSYIRGVVNANELLEQKAQCHLGIASGNLYIATIPSVAVNCFPDMLKSFSRQYPDVKILLKHGNYSDVEEMLANGSFDCGFLSVTPKTPFKYDVLFREKLSAVLPPHHPLAKKPILRLKDLEGEDFIMPGEGPNHQVGELIAKYRLKYDCKYTISDDDATMSMVAGGMGVSILPELSYKDYLNFKVAIRDFEEGPYRDIGIAYSKRNELFPAGHNFINFVKAYFKDRELHHCKEKISRTER